LIQSTFPQIPRLAANLAGTEGLLFGGFDVLANCVIGIIHLEAQTAKFLLHLQDFKVAGAS
jgi:hypothetical protein